LEYAVLDAVKEREKTAGNDKTLVTRDQVRSAPAFDPVAMADEVMQEQCTAASCSPKADVLGFRPQYVARRALENFDWGRKYPAIAQSWRRNWEHVIPFFAFPVAVRRIIYTTQASSPSLGPLARQRLGQSHDLGPL